MREISLYFSDDYLYLAKMIIFLTLFIFLIKIKYLIFFIVFFKIKIDIFLKYNVKLITIYHLLVCANHSNIAIFLMIEIIKIDIHFFNF